MKTIFKELAEVREFVVIDISGNFKTISPFLLEAHKFLLKGIDKATLDSLIDYVDTALEPDPDMDNLLEYARRVLANFAYAISAERLGVYVGENGIMEFSNNNLEPLSTEKLKNIKSEFFNSGYNALEMLILFIQDNAEAYQTAWDYLFKNTFFVKTAADLNSLIFTDVQNRDFFDLKPILYLIEKELEGILTTALMDTLKANNNLSDANASMLNICREAEACMAYGLKFKSDEHILRGRQLIQNLQAAYDTSIDSTTETWSNEGKRIFVFG